MSINPIDTFVQTMTKALSDFASSVARPQTNTQQLDLFANAPEVTSCNLSGTCNNTCSSTTTAQPVDLFAYAPDTVSVYEECSYSLTDTEDEYDVPDESDVINNLHLVADQLSGLGRYNLASIVSNVAELV